MSATPKPSHTVADLTSWPHQGPSLAVLGHPVAHSLSPQMHNAALACVSQTVPALRDWRYYRFEVAPEALAGALPRLETAGFRGINLTVPHKVDALDLIAEVSPQARVMGAVNTLELRPQGGYLGHNTDGFGLAEAIRRDLGRPLQGAPVLLLGAGGAARASAVKCLADACASLWIMNRSRARLDGLLTAIASVKGSDAITVFDIDSLPETLPEGMIVVNATSLGLKADDPSPLPLDRLHSGLVVYDMTYGVDNALAQACRARSVPYADGLSMLVWQGVKALAIWTRTDIPAQVMMTAACHARNLPHRHV